MSDAELAAALAEEGGSMLLRQRGQGPLGEALGQARDERAHWLITDGLATHRPHNGFLSEESPDSSSRFRKGLYG